MHIKFRSEHLNVRDLLENLGVDGKIILEWILWKWGGRLWNRFIWLRVGTSGEFL
jgi:hypothetical protein